MLRQWILPSGHRSIVIGLTVVALLLTSVAAPPAGAITVQDEEELSREFLGVLFRHYNIISEPLVTGYLDRIGRRLLAALPPQPFDYHFYMIDDPTYNAFATPAGHIFINSGLVAALESDDELAGIIGHEIAHVVCRHISQKIESSKKIGAATMAGVIAGLLLGSAGAGELASALTVGSMAAGQTLALSYSREDEMQADQLGLQNLAKAGYSGKGLLNGLKTIRSRQWFGTKEMPTYLKTHPAVEERMAYIDNWTQQQESEKKPVWRPDPQFAPFHVWTAAMYGDIEMALQHYERAVRQTPDDPMAHYGYALALKRSGDSAAAITHLRQALARAPLAPYLLKDLGRFYFEDGRYGDALNVLQSLNAGESPPEAMFYLGRTLLETGREPEALRILDTLVARHPAYREARYFLGEALGRTGRLPEAHYHLGLYHWATRDIKNARFHLERALDGMHNETRRDQIQELLKQMDKAEEKHMFSVSRRSACPR